MEQNNNNNNLGDKVVADLQKDFVAVGKHHVHGWYAWAIVGIVLGMAVGILYVANQNAQFNASNASMMPNPAITAQYTAPAITVKGTLEIYKDLAEKFKEENNGRLPDVITVRPAELVTKEGEGNDSLALGEPRTFLMQNELGIRELEMYLGQFNSLNNLADVIFGNQSNSQGYVIFPRNLDQGTDFAQTFAVSGQATGGSSNTTKVVPNLCVFNLIAKFTVDGKEYEVPVKTDPEVGNGKSAKACTPGSDGNQVCFEAAVDAGVTAARVKFLEEHSGPIENTNDEIEGSMRLQKDRSVCKDNGVAK